MSKTLDLAEKLKQLIETLPSGAKLPTVRELMKRYKISISVFNKAVDILKNEGLVNVVQGSGIYVAEKASASKMSCVDIVYFGNERSLQIQGFIRDLIHTLSIEFGADNISTKFTFIPSLATIKDILKTMNSLTLEAVIVMSPSNPGFLSYLNEKRIPYSCINPEMLQRPPNSVFVDNEKVMELIINHLYENGHRQIAYAHSLDKQHFLYSSIRRYFAFYEECAKHKLIPNQELIKFSGYTYPEFTKNVFNEMLNSKYPFTTVIGNDHTINAIYQAISEHGLKVGEDISVIGIDNLEMNSHLQPQLTTINIPRQEIAHQAKLILEQCFKEWSCDIPSIAIQPTLILGKSVKKLG